MAKVSTAPYPFPLLCPQSRTEQLLTARLTALGVQIERSVELVGLAQDGFGRERNACAMPMVASEDRQRRKYLAGCDGARSARTSSAGDRLRRLYGAADLSAWPTCRSMAATSIIGASICGGTTAAPSRCFRSAMTSGASSPCAANLAKGNEPSTLEEMQHCIERHRAAGPRAARSELAVDLSHQRAAGGAVSRRAAASSPATPRTCTSPVGGQGMNTGIQDAVNLAWKLAYALNGVGTPKCCSTATKTSGGRSRAP